MHSNILYILIHNYICIYKIEGCGIRYSKQYFLISVRIVILKTMLQ